MEDKEHTIDLIEVGKVIIKKRKPIIKVTIACVLFAIVYVLVASPVYESTSLLQIKVQKGLGSSLLDSMGGGGSANQQQMNTYSEVLKSRGVVIPVIEATEEMVEGKYPDYESYVQRRITTSPYKGTDILQVALTANSPEKAQKANSMLVKSFLKRMAEMNREAQTQTKSFLEERAKQAKAELEVAENALDDYKANNRITSPSDSAKSFADSIAEAKKQAIANDIALKTAQVQLAAVNKQLGSKVEYIADNRVVQQYRSELARAEAERISYLGKYKDKHPKMIDVTDRIRNLQIKIQEEIERISSLEVPSDNSVHQSLIAGKFRSESEIVVAQAKAAALQKIIDENNEELEKLPALERGYVRVARDAQVSNEIYVMLAKRLEEAKVAEVMMPNNVQILDESTLPEKPIRPRRVLITVMALLWGFLLSSGYFVLNEMYNRTVRTVDDVRSCLGLSVIGSVPDEVGLAKLMEKQDADYKKGILDIIKEFLWKE